MGKLALLMEYLINSMCFAIFIVLTFSPKAAYAYIDPGAGSSALQIIIAVLITGIFIMKLGFKKFKAFFKDIVSRKQRKRNGRK